MYKSRNLSSDWLFDAIIYLFLGMFALLCLYPLYQSIVLSFNDGKDAILGGVYFWPRKWSLVNYRLVFSNKCLLTAFFVTVSRTISGTLLSIFVTSMMAYSLSKKFLVLGKFYTILCIITMYFGGGLIPFYLLIRSLNLIDNFLVLILPGVVSVWNMLVFKAFFENIPASLEDSARLDGANYLMIFFRIVVPTSFSVYAALSLFTAVGLWNEWFQAILFINKREDLYPMQTILNSIINQTTAIEELQRKSGASEMAKRLSGVTTRSVIVTNMVVISAPIIIIYPFLQKYFVKGVMLGSIKG